MQIALHTPGIAANFGNILRSCACFGVPLSVIEPTGFPLAAKDVRRAAMDYGADVDLIRHANWDAFAPLSGRTVLFTTRAAQPLQDFAFAPTDRLVFGNESSGVPDAVHEACDARVVIPIRGRSLNLSNAVAIALFEALRQTGGLP
ncbi:tRNA (cytidine(34)-2'-O)-methyltransferase [uncultured Algimonas sp.]|uniref:tRNA (cytidine(34)-2'-O)-methyltransferase n=1 Tax=uncultured Algimonas sp. TaxID=1547920 RepID=UPI00261E8606|nr:tRNA (cytidine(34)-2'-O)-methyltransferase [uncultured Algimonas sp.]